MNAGYKAAIVLVLGLAVVIGVLAGRNQASSSAVAAPPQPTTLPSATSTPVPGEIAIVDTGTNAPPARFYPESLTVRLGQKVTFVNQSSGDVSAAADNSAFNTDVLSPGQSFTWTATKAGRYAYSSFNNPNESGVIVVTP
jgi:plastocyanin